MVNLFAPLCLRQGRILIHTGQKTPGHPNWTAEPLFTFQNPVSTIVLPGYPEPLGVRAGGLP